MLRIQQTVGGRAAEGLLIHHLLRSPLRQSLHQEIVFGTSWRGSYATLGERIGRLAGALSALKVGEGTTVAVMDWDSHRYLECYFAVPMMGAVLMTVNLRLSPEQITYTLQHSGATVLLVHADFLPLVSSLRPQLPRLETLVVLEPDAVNPAPGLAGEYEALLAAAVPFTFREFDERAVATTFYTTGTTGLPKAVSFSHRQIVVHTLAVMAALGSASRGQSLRHGDVYMPLTPMFHVHAWGLPYVATLMGLKQVYPGRYDPARLLDLRRREGVTYSHCVPTILRMLLSAPQAAATDFTGWKITVGGAALDGALARAAIARGIDVFAGYGMSETCPFLLVSRLPAGGHEAEDADLELRCASGLALPLVDLRVVDEQFENVPADGVSMGEIVVRAPWLTEGYVGDEEASADLWRGGFLHTRDLASHDTRGYVRIRDRLKDVIKSGGEWISSLLLEELTGSHAAIAEVAVIAMPDALWGERPLAVIVCRPGMRVDHVALAVHLGAYVEQGRITRYAIPARVECVDALPRTSVGKVDKAALRRRFPA